MNARYQNPTQGQFISQDPVARDIGMMQKMPPYILAASGMNPAEVDQNTLLASPQLQNSYSYSGNNPINYSDPSGKFLQALAAPLATFGPVGWMALGGIFIASTWLEVELIKHAPNYSSGQSGVPGAPARGLPPEGVSLPTNIPGVDPGTLTPGPASRPSEKAKGGESLWTPNGGEVRYFPGDDRHNPHWDYNPWQKGQVDGEPGNKWRNIPIDGKPTTKPDAPTQSSGTNNSNKTPNKKP